jgi:anti-sigma regulatory factor (Ser/Thr protein kinase)
MAESLSWEIFARRQGERGVREGRRERRGDGQEVLHPGQGRVRRLRLAGHLLRRARCRYHQDRLRRILDDAHCAQRNAGVLDTAKLLVSELVTNAVIHGTPPLLLRVSCREGVLRVGVSDTSPALPVIRMLDPDAAHGRGVALVEVLADIWGVESNSAGKQVWFQLRTAAPASRCGDLPGPLIAQHSAEIRVPDEPSAPWHRNSAVAVSQRIRTWTDRAFGAAFTIVVLIRVGIEEITERRIRRRDGIGSAAGGENDL